MRSLSEIIRIALLTVVSCAACANGSHADEPAAEFVNALRNQGYYDVALEYLADVKDDPLVSEKFRKTIPYERASTLIDQVATMRDREQIENQLDEAQQLLAEYVRQNGSLVERVKTLNFSGQLLSRRADLRLREAEAEFLTADEREKILVKARGFLEASLKSVTDATAGAARLLDPSPDNPDAIKISSEDPGSRALVREIRGIYQSLLVQRPYVAERLADTFPVQAPERRQLLADAAEVLNRIWNQYPNSVAGVQACVYSGRCFQKLGKHKEALDQFTQVMALDRSSMTSELRKIAFSLAAESWQQSDPYPVRGVIGQLERVVESLTRAEMRDPDWLRVVLELGMAKRKLAETIKSEGGSSAVSKSKSLDREAARFVREVTRSKNPHRQRARGLLAEWDVPLIEPAEAGAEAKIDSFASAFEAVKRKVTEIELLAGEVVQAKQSNRSVDSLQKKLMDRCNQTIEILDAAIGYADGSTSPSDLNLCRYFQCYCYFVSQRYLEASVIGQFLLDQHPELEGSKRASGLLLKSRSAMVAAADKSDNLYELQTWKNSSLEVASRWPGSPEAATAVQALIQIAVRDGRMRDAVEYMEKLPADSGSRSATAALLGQQLFAKYLRDSKDPKLAVNENQMQGKLEEALGFLRMSESLAKPGAVQFRDAVSGLMLVEATLLRGDADAAVQILDTSQISPLKIIKDQTPAVFRDARAPKFKSDAYRAIVKTYIAKMQNSDQQQRWIDKANGVIGLMRQEAEASGDPQQKAQLTSIYQLIAIELKKRFDGLEDVKQKSKFSAVLGKVLASIEKSSQQGKVVLVSGATLLEVATEISEGGLQSDAKPLFRQAKSALDRAEKLGFSGEKNAEALAFELKRQRALAERGAGNFEASVEQFIAILKESNSFAVQLDAAATLQRWGKAARLQKPLLQAVKGTGEYEDPKTKRKTNAVWGWERILGATRSNKAKFREQYFLSSYSIAEAMYEQSVIMKKPASKKSAIRWIKRERAKTPEYLGSLKWKQKFLDLENRIANDK